MVYQVKFIKPKKMKIDQIRLKLLNEMREEGTAVRKEYEKTTASWKSEKPKFETLIGLTGQDATILTGPTGSTLAVNKFKWLDEGTRIRWALMSSDWQSKTKPGFIGSRSGRGKVLVIGKKRMRRPRPGIKARGWTDLIQKRRKKPFIDRMIKAARVTTNDIY